MLHFQPDVICVVSHNYIILSKLLGEHENEFLKIVNQRLFAVNNTLNVLSLREIFINLDGCPEKHETGRVTKHIIWAATNII